MLTCVAASPAWAPPATIGSVPDRTYLTNGVVNTVVRFGDTIYLGGRRAA